MAPVIIIVLLRSLAEGSLLEGGEECCTLVVIQIIDDHLLVWVSGRALLSNSSTGNSRCPSFGVIGLVVMTVSWLPVGGYGQGPKWAQE